MRELKISQVSSNDQLLSHERTRWHQPLDFFPLALSTDHEIFLSCVTAKMNEAAGYLSQDFLQIIIRNNVSLNVRILKL